MQKEAKMKILVVEDGQKNIKAAKDQLKGHELIIVSGYDQAHGLLKERIDLCELGEFLERELPMGWELGKKWEFDNGYGCWDLKSGGKEVSCFEAPEAIKAIYQAAEKRATHIPFDAVLTDVMIPKGGYECMSDKGRALVAKQKEMPYGPVIALRALQIGIKKVGVLTQGNHHDDPFVFAFDGLGKFTLGDVEIFCGSGLDTPKGVKDWAKLLSFLE